QLGVQPLDVGAVAAAAHQQAQRMAARGEGTGDGGADEAGSAGDEGGAGQRTTLERLRVRVIAPRPGWRPSPSTNAATSSTADERKPNSGAKPSTMAICPTPGAMRA